MGGIRQSADPLAAFILEDGSINLTSFGGTGFARATNTHPNSIGFNGITPARNNSVYGQNIDLTNTAEDDFLRHETFKIRKSSNFGGATNYYEWGSDLVGQGSFGGGSNRASFWSGRFSSNGRIASQAGFSTNDFSTGFWFFHTYPNNDDRVLTMPVNGSSPIVAGFIFPFYLSNGATNQAPVALSSRNGRIQTGSNTSTFGRSFNTIVAACDNVFMERRNGGTAIPSGSTASLFCSAMIGVSSGSLNHRNAVMLGGSSYAATRRNCATGRNLSTAWGNMYLMGDLGTANDARIVFSDKSFGGRTNGNTADDERAEIRLSSNPAAFRTWELPADRSGTFMVRDTANAYTISNFTTRRTIDLSSFTLQELGDLVCTLINDVT